MPYDADTDPYLDPITGILRNSLDITSQPELEEAEADLSTVVLATLPDNPIKGDFNLRHLYDIHKALLGAIYPWAGELRTVEMTKGSTRFANPEFLEKTASKLFNELNDENILRGLTMIEYVPRLAHYYSEINILHPFREGNGRTQRAFFTLLAKESDHRIKWELMDVAENLNASINAYRGDESDLINMFKRLITSA